MRLRVGPLVAFPAFRHTSSWRGKCTRGRRLVEAIRRNMFHCDTCIWQSTHCKSNLPQMLDNKGEGICVCGAEVKLHSFSISALDGEKRSASCLSNFTSSAPLGSAQTSTEQEAGWAPWLVRTVVEKKNLLTVPVFEGRIFHPAG